ncbi:hypothetical protein ACHAW6_012717 [Cyclotella cf. meneghiniana]
MTGEGSNQYSGSTTGFYSSTQLSHINIGHFVCEWNSNPAHKIEGYTADQNRLTGILQLYGWAGFIVQTALMDKVIDAIATECPTLLINTPTTNEHVRKIEHALCLVKERA